MASWRPFGYEGKPGTCLWCGERLYRGQVLDSELEDKLRAEGLSGQQAFEQALKPAGKLGAYADDSFCRLRCGYQFGLRLAQLGNRLKSSDR